jgi:Transglycosylase SLT domain
MGSIASLVIAEANRQGIDPQLALGVGYAESGLNSSIPDSRAGAIGIFQLEPDTARALGVDPRDPNQNIQGGITYLRQMLAQFGDPMLALAAYNWGPGHMNQAIAAYGASWAAIAPNAPSETQNYVAKIIAGISTSQDTRLFNPGPAPFPVASASGSVLTIPQQAELIPNISAVDWGGMTVAIVIFVGVVSVVFRE